MLLDHLLSHVIAGYDMAAAAGKRVSSVPRPAGRASAARADTGAPMA